MTPNKAEMEADKLKVLNFLSLALKKTASAAPACAKAAGPIRARMVSEPLKLILLIANGTRLQCKPKITIG
ncbi:hypothetical protein D3C75_1165560 [compost metagenome]